MSMSRRRSLRQALEKRRRSSTATPWASAQAPSASRWPSYLTNDQRTTIMLRVRAMRTSRTATASMRPL